MKTPTVIATFAALLTMLAAGGASASIGDVVAAVDPGIVDVNTNLGYQGSSAAGTGIVLTSSGEVLTNNHVIRGATTVRVTDVGNGRSYTATVVGYSVSADIAVLQLRGASNLATVKLGDSSRAKVGDAVAALGNAGGLGGAPASATGKITALGRSITASDGESSAEELRGLIETNAALEPGDSGGPLVDSSGRVLGIDTAGSQSFQFQYRGGSGSGGGYAIPIDRAMTLARQILSAHSSSATTHVGPSPMIGVGVQPRGGYYGDYAGPGAVVTDVLPSSPADRAGLGTGDTITAIDGRKIDSPSTLTNLLLLRAPGDTIHVAWVDQFGNTRKAAVKLATGPPQ
jgi:S1-C subfamily serine protease